MTAKIQSILGIPIHKLDMQQTVETIFQLIRDYRNENCPRARYVATVNVDFLTNTWDWRLGEVRHPELLETLRKADLVTADGMPIVWLSKLLGSPLPGRVTGADLVWELAKECEKRGSSIFLFGAQEGLGQQAAAKLREKYPALKIAGILAPYIQVDGRGIIDAEEDDDSLVEKINQSGADILLLALGNPKQEQWFRRVQHKLKVPVSIGVGGALNFVVGNCRRAPEWIQKAGFEWLFRVVQEPGRLWKRYFQGAVKLAAMTIPMLCGEFWSRWTSSKKSSELKIKRSSQVWDITLPSKLKRKNCQGLQELFQLTNPPERIVIDFSQVYHMDPEGLGSLHEIWRWASKQGVSVGSSNVPKRLSYLLKTRRMWDLIQLESSHVLRSHHCQLEVKQEADSNVLLVQGPFSSHCLSRDEQLALMEALDGKPCVVDLSCCPFLDSSGLEFLLKLRRRLLVNNRLFALSELNPTVEKVLRLSKVNDCVQICSTLEQAKNWVTSVDALSSAKCRV